MPAVLSAVADRPLDLSPAIAMPRRPSTPAKGQPEPQLEPHDGHLPDVGIGTEPPLASPPIAVEVDDLSRGACGAMISPVVNQTLRSELSGYDDDSELGDEDSPGVGDDDDDDLDEFDEIDEDDFDDEFDDDFEEELEDEYEIEIEDEISAEFGLGPDKDDEEEEELDDLDSLADDLDDDIDDDLKE